MTRERRRRLWTILDTVGTTWMGIGLGSLMAPYLPVRPAAALAFIAVGFILATAAGTAVLRNTPQEPER